MPLNFLTALHDDTLLGLELFRLLGQPGRRGIDLAGLLVHLGLASFQACLAVSQRTPQLGELALPLDELLTKGCNSEAMLFTVPVQGLLLLPDLPCLRQHL